MQIEWTKGSDKRRLLLFFNGWGMEAQAVAHLQGEADVAILSDYRTLALLPYPWFPGFYCQHIPEAYLKSTFQDVWDQEFEVLDRTCRDRFRSRTNVNQWLFKYWQLASGNFIPRRLDIGLCYHLRDANFSDACRDVQTRKYPMICLNDTPETENPDEKMRRLREIFEEVFPAKSEFEI